MENPGEHLVEQYLKLIKRCDFVEYNLQTISPQGEMDVVGINSGENRIYICEVATHLETGLSYNKAGKRDNVNRFKAKFTKNIEYAKKNFQGYKCHYMLWSPIIKIPKKEDTKDNQFRDLQEIKTFFQNEFNVEVELIYNQKYLDCINELREKAKATTQEMASPIMRFLQIEEKLLVHCKKTNTREQQI
ncbi:MAG: hypothetical protein LBI15_07710 [Dysgonamonadaceae bacterium]|jgi:hypothetical protein|nr:hypothetical protein [Dysgonamonadaceae bacterium]